MSGKEYISQREKQLPEKVVKLVDCNNCKYKCTKNITEDRGEEYMWYVLTSFVSTNEYSA
jgi:hypothetical protein